MKWGIITISENGGGHHTDRSRMDDAAGNVRCVQCIRLRHPQGNPCHLQEYGIIGKRHHALRQAGQRDKLREMVIAIAFRLRTKECMAFRRFVMGKLYAASRKEPLYLFFSLAAYPRKEHNC